MAATLRLVPCSGVLSVLLAKPEIVLIRWTPSGGAQLLIYNSQLRGSLIPEVPRDVDFLWMCKMCILMHVCVVFADRSHSYVGTTCLTFSHIIVYSLMI